MANGKRSIDERIRLLEAKVAELKEDLRLLRQLLELDYPSALNKVRYITERILVQLCRAHDLSWGKGEHTLERMIGPLVSAGVIPKDIAPFLRTIQAHSSPGSHFQETPLADGHARLAEAALVHFLEWHYKLHDKRQNAPPAKKARPETGSADTTPDSDPALPFRARTSTKGSGGPIALRLSITLTLAAVVLAVVFWPKTEALSTTTLSLRQLRNQTLGSTPKALERGLVALFPQAEARVGVQAALGAIGNESLITADHINATTDAADALHVLLAGETMARCSRLPGSRLEPASTPRAMVEHLRLDLGLPKRNP